MSVVPTTRALLLAHAEDRNANRTVTVLTEDFGLLRLTARSSRSSAAKLGGVLEPFALTTLTFAEGRSRPTVVGSVPEEGYPALGQTPLGFAAAHVAVNAVTALVHERSHDPGLFHALRAAFVELNAAAARTDPPQVWWTVARFLGALLHRSGIGVSRSVCARCGRGVTEGAVWSSGHGGLHHPEHAAGPRLRLPPETLHALTALEASGRTVPAGSLAVLALLLREVQLAVGRELPSVRYAERTAALPLPANLARLLYSER